MMDGGFMELAQKRIREAMERSSCSESDMDKQLGLRPGIVAKVLAGEPGMHPYAERIALDLGRDDQPDAAQVCTETMQDEAIRRLKALKDALDVTWPVLGKKLGYPSPVSLRNLVQRHRAGNLGQESAQRLLERIEAMEQESSIAPDLNDTDHDGLDAHEPPRTNRDPKPRTASGNNFWTTQKSVEKNEAARLLEEILGIDLSELRTLKPQIEMLIMARRNGVPARVIVDPVEVR